MKEKHLYLNVSQLHTSMGVTDRLNPFQVLQKKIVREFTFILCYSVMVISDHN
jgi:hypothetical protein